MIRDLEWWLDYGPGPLTGARGGVVETEDLALPPDLVERLDAWNAAYSEDKLPIDGPGDEVWLAAGRQLLADVRIALAGRYSVSVTEPWWGEEPSTC